jgi:uncharacterized protein (TIGR02646 family)
VIRVVKPEQPPAILLERGRAKQIEHEQAFEVGQHRFEFDRAIYAHASVSEALQAAQYHKCCFCERKVENGDVEHFRPKASVRQARNAEPEQPGYYWLAYEWTNLYFACVSCNQRNKRDLFPLANPDARVRSHGQPRLAEEQPIFIDPGVDEPEQLIGFREGEPYAIDDNARAVATIVALELGRIFLMECRRDAVQLLEPLIDMLKLAAAGTCPDLLEPVASTLAARARDDAEFASMTRYLIRDKLGLSVRAPVTTEALLAVARGESIPGP